MAVTVLAAATDGNEGSGIGPFERNGVLYGTHALPTSAADLKMLPFKKFSGGYIYVSANVTLTWYVAFPDAPTTAYAALKADGTAITQATGGTDKAIAIPPELFGAALIGCVASGAANAKVFLKK